MNGNKPKVVKYIDLFCGLGAFHTAFNRTNNSQNKIKYHCVFASDFDEGIQKIYNEALNNIPGVSIFPQPDWAEGACWLSGVTMSNVESAESLRGQLKENNIEAKPFWKSIHLQPMFLNSPATAQPISSDIWSRIVILPCSTGLMGSEQTKVITTIQKILH